MTLIPLNEILENALQYGYAVGAFNINTDIQAQAIFQAAYDMRSPLIVQASKGACAFQGQPKDEKNPTNEELIRGAKRIKGIAELVSEAYPRLDYVLHLDHGSDKGIVMNCVEAGFSSVMIDYSHLPFGQNKYFTKKVVDWVREYGKEHGRYISVEAELGTMGGKSHSGGKGEIVYANACEVARFAKETGVDALAIAWGTRHGPNKFASGEMDLRPEVIKKCYDALEEAGLQCYLVSHGSSTVPRKYVDEINKYSGDLTTSGVPEDKVRQAIQNGAVKVNIDTNLRLAMTAAIRKALHENPGTIDPRDYLNPARQAMYESVKECIQLFGSYNKI